MSDHGGHDTSHSSTDDSHAHHAAPSVPTEIRDEAPDSPTWLPWVGLGIVVLAAALISFFTTTVRRGDAEVTSGNADIVVAPPPAAPAPAPRPSAPPSPH